MQNVINAETHLNNRIGNPVDGDGLNGPVVTYKATQRNLAIVVATATANATALGYFGRSCPCGVELQGEDSLSAVCPACLPVTAGERSGWVRIWQKAYVDLVSVQLGYGDLPERPSGADGSSVDYGHKADLSDEAKSATKDLHLSTYDTIEVERKVDGLDGWQPKAEAVGKAIGLNPNLWGDLAGYVADFSRRIPLTFDNRRLHIQNLESYIWLALLEARDRLQGNWDLVKLTVSGRYRDWYKAWNAQAVGDAERHALSLDRKAYSDAISDDDFRVVVDDDSEIGEDEFEATVEAEYNSQTTLTGLPEPIRDVLRKRLWDIGLTAQERKRLSRFLAGSGKDSNGLVVTNADLLRSKLTTSIETQSAPTVEYFKSKR